MSEKPGILADGLQGRIYIWAACHSAPGKASVTEGSWRTAEVGLVRIERETEG
jgi:hypothetical protein